MDDLTPDELAELAQLEAEYGNSPQSSNMAAPAVPTIESNRELVQEVLPNGEKITINQPKNEISQTQAMVTSLLEGASGKFAGEVAGGIGAAVEIAVEEDHSFADWSALYHKNKDIFDTMRKDGESAYPWSTGLAEAAGGVGFASLLGAGGVAVNTVKGAATAGGIAGFGAGDIRDPNDLAMSTATGAALGGISQKILNKFLPSKAANAAKITDEVASKSLETEQSHIILNALGINSKGDGRQITAVAKKAVRELGKRKQDINDWATSIAKTADGEFTFQPGDSFLDVKGRMSNQKEFWGNAISEVVGEADSIVTKNGFPGLSADKFFGHLDLVRDSLMANGLTDNQLVLFEKLKKPYINATHLSFSDAQNLNRSLSDLLGDFGKNFKGISDVAWKAKDAIRTQLLEGMQALDPSIADAYKLSSKKWGDFHLADKLLAEPAQAASLEALNGVQNMVLSAGKRFSQAAMLGSKVGVVSSVADGLRAALGGNVAGIAGKRLQSIGKVMNALESGPGVYQDIASRLLSAASREPELFAHELGYAESVIDLSQNPIQRNMQDVVVKLPQALNIIRDKSPQLYSDLLRNIQSNNVTGVGEIISNLSKTPEGSRFIAPGIGFEGRVVTSADYENVKSQITNSPQNNRVKARQLMDLDRDGMIPQFENPREFMKQTIAARRKNNQKVADF